MSRIAPSISGGCCRSVNALLPGRHRGARRRARRRRVRSAPPRAQPGVRVSHPERTGAVAVLAPLGVARRHGRSTSRRWTRRPRLLVGEHDFAAFRAADARRRRARPCAACSRAASCASGPLLRLPRRGDGVPEAHGAQHRRHAGRGRARRAAAPRRGELAGRDRRSPAHRAAARAHAVAVRYDAAARMTGTASGRTSRVTERRTSRGRRGIGLAPSTAWRATVSAGSASRATPAGARDRPLVAAVGRLVVAPAAELVGQVVLLHDGIGVVVRVLVAARRSRAPSSAGVGALRRCSGTGSGAARADVLGGGEHGARRPRSTWGRWRGTSRPARAGCGPRAGRRSGRRPSPRPRPAAPAGRRCRRPRRRRSPCAARRTADPRRPRACASASRPPRRDRCRACS